jgi:hypothetical protein
VRPKICPASLPRPATPPNPTPQTLRDCLFLTAAGLRGSASLIMGQAVVTEVAMWSPDLVRARRGAGRGQLFLSGLVPQPASTRPRARPLPSRGPALPRLPPHPPSTTSLAPPYNPAQSAESQVVKSQVVFWTAGFVMLTLLINAPLLPWVLRVTGLSAIPPKQLARRRRAVEALAEHTRAAVEQLRGEEDEMLTGVDWAHVERYCDVTRRLGAFVAGPNPPPPPHGGGGGGGGSGGALVAALCCGCCGGAGAGCGGCAGCRRGAGAGGGAGGGGDAKRSGGGGGGGGGGFWRALARRLGLARAAPSRRASLGSPRSAPSASGPSRGASPGAVAANGGPGLWGGGLHFWGGGGGAAPTIEEHHEEHHSDGGHPGSPGAAARNSPLASMSDTEAGWGRGPGGGGSSGAAAAELAARSAGAGSSRASGQSLSRPSAPPGLFAEMMPSLVGAARADSIDVLQQECPLVGKTRLGGGGGAAAAAGDKRGAAGVAQGARGRGMPPPPPRVPGGGGSAGAPAAAAPAPAAGAAGAGDAYSAALLARRSRAAGGPGAAAAAQSSPARRPKLRSLSTHSASPYFSSPSAAPGPGAAEAAPPAASAPPLPPWGAAAGGAERPLGRGSVELGALPSLRAARVGGGDGSGGTLSGSGAGGRPAAARALAADPMSRALGRPSRSLATRSATVASVYGGGAGAGAAAAGGSGSGGGEGGSPEHASGPGGRAFGYAGGGAGGSEGDLRRGPGEQPASLALRSLATRSLTLGGAPGPGLSSSGAGAAGPSGPLPLPTSAAPHMAPIAPALGRISTGLAAAYGGGPPPAQARRADLHAQSMPAASLARGSRRAGAPGSAAGGSHSDLRAAAGAAGSAGGGPSRTGSSGGLLGLTSSILGRGSWRDAVKLGRTSWTPSEGGEAKVNEEALADARTWLVSGAPRGAAGLAGPAGPAGLVGFCGRSQRSDSRLAAECSASPPRACIFRCAPTLLPLPSPPTPCAGLKRYFHGKRMQGLLSARGLRILDFGCDTLLDDPYNPVALWDVIERCVWVEGGGAVGGGGGGRGSGAPRWGGHAHAAPTLAQTAPSHPPPPPPPPPQRRHVHVGRQHGDLRAVRRAPRLGVADAPAPRPRRPPAVGAAAARGGRASAAAEQGAAAGSGGGHGVPHGPHLQPLRAVAAGGPGGGRSREGRREAGPHRSGAWLALASKAAPGRCELPRAGGSAPTASPSPPTPALHPGLRRVALAAGGDHR